jgi:acylphosphatase
VTEGAAPGKRLWARVHGRVQGVGFRATTVAVARRLDLAGWVRNLAAGDVELEAEGKPEALDELVLFLHRGPRGARVDGVDLDWLDPVGLPIPFATRSTA